MIYPYPNFLTPNECEEIINYSLPQLEPLTTFLTPKEARINKDRVGEGCFIFESGGVFGKIKNTISLLTNHSTSCIEPLNVIRYKVGGKYDPHFDFFGSNKDFKDKIEKEGDRKYTFIIYLNDSFKGGSTYFPKMGVEIHPFIGNLVIWSNISSKGVPYYNSLHAGMPVEEGEKWVLVSWIKERKK